MRRQAENCAAAYIKPRFRAVVKTPNRGNCGGARSFQHRFLRSLAVEANHQPIMRITLDSSGADIRRLGGVDPLFYPDWSAEAVLCRKGARYSRHQ